MSKMKILILLVFILKLTYCNAQEKRSFTFNNDIIEYICFTNMSSGLQAFPNHNAKIILVKDDTIVNKYIELVNIKNQSEARKDHTFYYYVKLPRLKNVNHYITFLQKFVKTNYRQDFFDRNKVSLSLNEETIPFSCSTLSRLNLTFAKILVSKSSSLLDCKSRFIVTDNTDKNESLVTSEKYDISDHESARQQREYYKMINELAYWRKTFFLDISLGQNFINSAYKTSFDEETLVDISDTKSIWQFNIGYMFSNKFGGLLDFGFMSSKEQDINFSTLSGTASGFVVFKLGFGIRYIPFAKKNWSIYSDLKGGTLNVKTAGGSGGIGGSNVTESSEANNYLGVSIGAIHRLGKVVFLKSNFEYTNSSFENNIGSISGFTGYTINLGIGFSF